MELVGVTGVRLHLVAHPLDRLGVETTEVPSLDLLKPPFDRSHKKPGGYIIKHKLEAVARSARLA